MSTGTTQNLGLHLWDEEDYVLMEEFNADHQAIDSYVTTAAGLLAQQQSRLLRAIGQNNYRFYHEYLDAAYAGSGTALSYPTEGFIFNGLDSTGAIGTVSGTNADGGTDNSTYSSSPLNFGLCSGVNGFEDQRIDNIWHSFYHPENYVTDAVIRKTLTLDGSYCHARLIVQARGYTSTPTETVNRPADVGNPGQVYISPDHQTEDYTGITLAAGLGNQAMTAAGYRVSHWPASIIWGTAESTRLSNPTCREYSFELEAPLSGTVELSLQLHCPQDHGLAVFDWALLLS